MFVIKRLLLIALLLWPSVMHADDTGDALSELYEVYATVQQFCGGISDRISQVSGVSKTNAMITAIGAVTAGGAMYAGLKKEELDQQLEEMGKTLCSIGGCDPDKVESMTDEDFFNVILPILIEMTIVDNASKVSEFMTLKSQYEEKLKKSKNLGNWRTSLLAGTVGTNVASAVISGLNKNQSDLVQQISACNAAVLEFDKAYNKAVAFGVNPIENLAMQSFRITIDNCGKISEDDITKIENRMKAVMGTSIAGASIGAVGIGTSIAANTNAIRLDNSDKGKQKEKTLNTVSNVAAGANVITGSIETILGVSLITLTKKLIGYAEMCEVTL